MKSNHDEADPTGRLMSPWAPASSKSPPNIVPTFRYSLGRYLEQHVRSRAVPTISLSFVLPGNYR
eukprot:scaffold18251_cov65-Cyclotella_meneghiniana.AAC.1